VPGHFFNQPFQNEDKTMKNLNQNDVVRIVLMLMALFAINACRSEKKPEELPPEVSVEVFDLPDAPAHADTVQQTLPLSDEGVFVTDEDVDRMRNSNPTLFAFNTYFFDTFRNDADYNQDGQITFEEISYLSICFLRMHRAEYDFDTDQFLHQGKPVNVLGLRIAIDMFKKTHGTEVRQALIPYYRDYAIGEMPTKDDVLLGYVAAKEATYP
jgi:hypothetical protein